MTLSRRLAAHRAQTAASAKSGADETQPHEPTQDPNLPDDEDEAGKKKEDDMETVNKAEHEAAVAKAALDASTAANARWSAVLASEHYAGRETLAKTLLDQPSLDAAAITTALAAAPKVEPAAITDPAAVTAAAEEAARKEMQAAIASGGGNSTVDAVGAGSSASADASAGWGKAIAAANQLAGFSA